jgi:hypothetical protein
MISLPLSPEKEQTEWQTILTIANNNNFQYPSSKN